jgi:hypothetical protein
MARNRRQTGEEAIQKLIREGKENLPTISPGLPFEMSHLEDYRHAAKVGKRVGFIISSTYNNFRHRQLALLQQHLDKLPCTAKTLEEHVESRAGFAVRRVRWIAADCIQKRIVLQRWQLIRKAGVARLIEYPLVKDTIDSILQKF